MTTTKIDPLMTLTSPWGITRTVEQWMKTHEISEVYAIFGAWAVTDYGVECLTSYYPIAAKRLWEGEGRYGWIEHARDKTWINLPDFCAALEAARRHHARAKGKH